MKNNQEEILGYKPNERIAITNTQHQYVYTTEIATGQAGYRNVNDILGTTCFDLKAPVVEIAGFVHAINERVMRNKDKIVMLDISEYRQEGMQCAITYKGPFYNNVGVLSGVKTEAIHLKDSQIHPFSYELLKTAKKYHGKTKKGGLAFEVIGQYKEHGLSKQESSVMFLTAYGKKASTISGLLSLSQRIIERHIENIKDKLSLNGREEIAEYAIHSRLTEKVPKKLIYS